MIDFHSHFLPKVDDGSRSTEESEKLLRFLAGAGVTDVCATPHYIMHDESIAEFLARRDGAYALLRDSVDLAPLPAIHLGAEVKVERGLSRADGLDRLCYGGSRRVLFEFQYKAYEQWMAEEIYNSCYRHGITPVIAHLNRYFEVYTSRQIDEILSIDNVIIQINAEAFGSFVTHSKLKKLAKEGHRLVYGFDIHREKYIAENEKLVPKLGRFLASFPQTETEKEFFSGQ